MRNVDINVYCIAQTRMNSNAVRQWLDFIGASETPVPLVAQDDGDLCVECMGSGISDFETNSSCPECKGTGHPQAEVSDAGAVCGLCAKRCYMSFEPGLNPNITKVRKKWYDYLTNILASGHGSVFEHASWTFAIEGVSRVFTGEMNRHRAGVAISEGSMRYIRFDDIAFWMPSSLEPGNMSLMPTKKCPQCKGVPESIDDGYDRTGCGVCNGAGRVNLIGGMEYEDTKAMTRKLLCEAFYEAEENYRRLCELWGIEGLKDFSTKKKLTSLFRRIIPMGVATGGTWTFNARALRHVLALRSSPHAEEEIAMVMGMIGKYIVEHEPSIFGDFVLDEGCWVPKWEKV